MFFRDTLRTASLSVYRSIVDIAVEFIPSNVVSCKIGRALGQVRGSNPFRT